MELIVVRRNGKKKSIKLSNLNPNEVTTEPNNQKVWFQSGTRIVWLILSYNPHRRLPVIDRPIFLIVAFEPAYARAKLFLALH